MVKAIAISTNAATNCTQTKKFRKCRPLAESPKLPFRTIAGGKEVV